MTNKELEKMTKEIKKKIGFLVIFLMIGVAAITLYYFRNDIEYSLAKRKFNLLMQQCADEANRDGQLTRDESTLYVEKCVAERNKDNRFRLRLQ